MGLKKYIFILVIYVSGCSDQKINLPEKPLLKISLQGDYKNITDCLTTKLIVQKPESFIKSRKQILKNGNIAYIIITTDAHGHPSMEGYTYTYTLSPLVIVIENGGAEKSQLELYHLQNLNPNSESYQYIIDEANKCEMQIK